MITTKFEIRVLATAMVGTGRTLEAMIQAACKENGFTIAKWSKKDHIMYEEIEEILYTNVPLDHVIDVNGRTEFVLHSKRVGFDVRIECKNQSITGSAWEKLLYAYYRLAKFAPEPLSILVHGGSNRQHKMMCEWMKDNRDQGMGHRWQGSSDVGVGNSQIGSITISDESLDSID